MSDDSEDLIDLGGQPADEWSDGSVSPNEDASSPFEDPEQKRKGGCLTPLTFIVFLSVCAVLGALLVPNFIRARSRGQLTACKSNLKNIGTGFEMYSTDWGGRYPKTLDLLTPKYLKTIPDCPSAGAPSYSLETGRGVVYNSAGFDEYYFLQCEGKNHIAVSVPENYPQYDGITGLIER